MNAKLKYPGKDATLSFIRMAMRDGKWRITADIERLAKDKGLVVAGPVVGQYMGQLEDDGFLRSEIYGGSKMWKIRRCVLEATK